MNVTQGLRRVIQTNPGGLATVFGERRRLWGEIGRRVPRLAAGLRAMAVNPGDRMAILSLNSDRYLETYLAVAWAGAVIVPLNTRWSLIEYEDALRDCRARVLLVDKAFASTGTALAKAIPGLTLIYADDGSLPVGMEAYETLLLRSEMIPDTMRTSTDLAGIFYTGGTTGRAKGVMLSHGNLMAKALSMLGEGFFPGSTIYLHAAPMFHLANGCAMYALLLSGGRNVIIQVFTPEGVMAAFQNERATDVTLVPTMIQRLVESRALGNYDLSSMKHIAYGGSHISHAVLDRATAALPNVRFTQFFGMTESAAMGTTLHWQEHLGEFRVQGRHRSVGRPNLGCEVRIVDAENEPVPFGTIGELVMRGDAVMMGYWERPEESARALIDGWLHTGDGGYMDEEGFVFVVDRIKDMIISGGENVYSAEVENALSQHPAVEQCAVIGIPHEAWGEQVHAVVVTKSGAQVSANELIEFCRTLIAGYKCPRTISISETALPLSGAGKVLKRELRRPFWEGRERRVS